jgi:histidinol-phosphate aminotransferase
MSSTSPPWHELLRPELAAMRSYVPAAAPHAIRLDANESPYTLPPEGRAVLAEALAAVDTNRYPDVRATALRTLVAARENVDPDRIVLGCGSDEVIALLLTALARARSGAPRAAVLFVEPSFVMFRVTAMALGHEPVGVALDDTWDLDVPAMRSAIARTRPNVIFLPSPNNPTGNLFARDRIDAVIDAAPDALVVLDEAYGRFTATHYRDLAEGRANVARLQTLSKLGLAAARVGWAVLPNGLAHEVEKVRQPYNLNTFSQRAAELCLGELSPYFDRAVADIVSERTRLAAELASVPGVTVYHSEANFLWVRVARNAGEVHAALMAKGIVVRSFHASGGRLAHMLRISVGTPTENNALLEALPTTM